MNKNIMIIAGEASGDLHGAGLISELKKLNPALAIFGIGGDKMIAAGMNAQFHIKQMAFLGFVEIIRHLPFINKVKRTLIAKVESEKIGTAILIDYPGFNLDIASKFNEMGVKLVYYISPQIWAWGKGRIKKIKKLIDKMIVVFPFEEELYKNAGMDAYYVGHPLIEQIENYNFLSREELFEKLNLDKEKEILLVLPGSRKHEIRKIFPATIKAAIKLANDFNMQTVVACAENIDADLFAQVTAERNYSVVKGFTYDLMKYSKFGIVKSGTSTLEAGLMQLPFVVVYATSALTYRLGKMLVSINNIAMANIILGENVVEELIQKDVNEVNIYSKCSEYLIDADKYRSLKEKLSKLREQLGSSGASKRAAQIIYNVMNEAK